MTISALILAAGQSIRMGHPKMLLPWGETTVLGQVIETIQRAYIADIHIITGGAREEVEAIAAKYKVRTIFNEDFTNGEMLSSIQVGLRDLTPSALKGTSPREASLGDKSTKNKLEDNSDTVGGFGGGRKGVLIVLGDQPQIQARSVRAVASRFEETRAKIIVPSYQMRRGHPWLVARPLWLEILAMRAPESLREFLNRHAFEIEYVNVDNASILADLDTPDDYLKSRP